VKNSLDLMPLPFTKEVSNYTQRINEEMQSIRSKEKRSVLQLRWSLLLHLKSHPKSL
jgi:hypothetical protein